MEIEIRQGKYPGEWRMRPITDAWPQVSRDIYRGIEHSAGDIYEYVLTWTNPGASTPDDVLAALNQAVIIIQERLGSDAPLITELSDTATYADVKTALGEMLSISAWFLASTFASLANGNTSLAVRAFGRAAYWQGTFQAFLTRLQCDLESPPTGPAYALSLREDQVLKPQWRSLCRSLADSGAEIKTIHDLYRHIGDEHVRFKRVVTERTLKEWAGEEGITLKAGRPKKCA